MVITFAMAYPYIITHVIVCGIIEEGKTVALRVRILIVAEIAIFQQKSGGRKTSAAAVYHARVNACGWAARLYPLFTARAAGTPRFRGRRTLGAGALIANSPRAIEAPSRNA